MTEDLKIELDDDLPVHKENALKFICSSFASHEAGLPEWVKNSSDEYSRRENLGFEIPADQRNIVLLLKSGSGRNPARIACLDFSGMTSLVINKYFRRWVDPDSAKRGEEASGVQGGHGNGGKCYMSHMFDDHAFLLTVREGKGNRYGVEAGKKRFGYMPDRKTGCDFPVSNEQEFLSTALSDFGLAYDDLPPGARKLFERTRGFTIICGVRPKGYGNKLPSKQITTNLQQHPQMVQSIERCRILVFANGRMENSGKPLSLPKIIPREKAEEPREIEIPLSLLDPVSGQKVKTSNGDEKGKLILRTSNKSMHWKLKVRHNVTYITDEGNIGYHEVGQLGVTSTFAQYIYGECRLNALSKIKTNERYHLTNCSLSRAVNNFISNQIQKYAKEFEDYERKKYGKKAKHEVSRLNDFLNDWKNRFLQDTLKGLTGGGVGEGIPRPTLLPSGKPASMRLDMQFCRAGVGVSFRPRVRFFDKDDKQVRPVPYRWVSEDTNIAMVDEDLNLINTFSIGSTLIYAEALDGRLSTKKHPLDVVNIHKIELLPIETEVAVGGRSSLSAKCMLDGGIETTDVCLIWDEDNMNVARVSSTGTVFGVGVGTTKVTAHDERCEAQNTVEIRVVPPSGKGAGDKAGRGFPLVLVSGHDEDPDTKEEREFGEDEPPVVQRPQDVDRNIFWINAASPLAGLYLDDSKNYGYKSREWRMYHLERFIEVIIQITLGQDDNLPPTMSRTEWVQECGFKAAQIQSKAAEDLVDFIADGLN